MLGTYPDATLESIRDVRAALEIEPSDILEEFERHPERLEELGDVRYKLRADIEEQGLKTPSWMNHLLDSTSDASTE